MEDCYSRTPRPPDINPARQLQLKLLGSKIFKINGSMRTKSWYISLVFGDESAKKYMEDKRIGGEGRN